ncbi:hypothetical protein PCE1_004051 [Barthelona sp. PCE]
MRKLKFHEQKLLKKHNFFNYQGEHNLHEIEVIRRYRLRNREEYVKYNHLAGEITSFVNFLKQMESNDPMRVRYTQFLLDKLWEMGLISAKTSLVSCEKLGPAAFARRRLATVLVTQKFSPNLQKATEMIEQGHIRVGPNVITDPAFLVNRALIDHVHFTEDSKYLRHIKVYKDEVDDFVLLN